MRELWPWLTSWIVCQMRVVTVQKSPWAGMSSRCSAEIIVALLYVLGRPIKMTFWGR